jgi:diguanylate cyclase (GGDEF)-like protein
MDTLGYVLLGVVMIVTAVLLILLPHRMTPFAPALAVFAGMVFVTGSIIFNGERHGGPPGINELFYIWPVFYVAYFMPHRGMAPALVGLGVLYGGALAVMGMTFENAVGRFIVVLSVSAMTAIAARALRRHVDRLVERLHSLARTDPLTKLLNRRAFDERLAEELRRTLRTGEPFALLLGDIDHFKSINDRLGHAAGDAALVSVAELLTEGLRTVDAVARVGGEEFAVILPGTDVEGGVEVAERLRLALRTTTEHDGEPLTISFGVAEAPLHGSTADDLLRAADNGLYAAKAGGRDRTVAPEGPAAAAC